MLENFRANVLNRALNNRGLECMQRGLVRMNKDALEKGLVSSGPTVSRRSLEIKVEEGRKFLAFVYPLLVKLFRVKG